MKIFLAIRKTLLHAISCDSRLFNVLLELIQEKNTSVRYDPSWENLWPHNLFRNICAIFIGLNALLRGFFFFFLLRMDLLLSYAQYRAIGITEFIRIKNARIIVVNTS